ncbi:MAG TPA: LLM class flavin-dependent oxidoreductase [Ilumatobacter sp.]
MARDNIRGMRFGVSIPNFAEPEALLEVARDTEQGGWDGFFLWDHVLVDVGAPPPVCEPWTVLAAAATMTSRVRLGTMVTPLARRRPWVLARQVTTVDHLSHGRAVLGVGLGVPPEAEYAAFGETADPAEHAALVDEGLEVIDALWTGQPVTHTGRQHRLRDVTVLPRPIQRPRVPIWSAASLPARAGIRRAARWDGIVPIFASGQEFRPLTPDEVAGVVEEISSRRTSNDPFDVVVWVLAEDAEACAEYERAGATWLIHGPAPGDDWLADARLIAAGGPPV